MTDAEFTGIVADTKGVVLSAVGRYLDARFAHSIDDVVQETYLRAYRGLVKKSFREESSLPTWLYTIAKNESLRMNKKLSREEAKTARRISLVRDQEAFYDSLQFDHEVFDLKNAVASLPDKYRIVMELLIQGMSVEDVASSLSLPAGTVKSRSSRGREILHKILKEGDYDS